ncbi:MAG: asparaginase [Planctomycetes bacterium]|nr:asparaginase [Planctomycetota bacterium]
MASPQKKITLISTGGTIEKTYDEQEGILANGTSVLELMLGSLQLDGVVMTHIALMDRDSREMTEQDHEHIAQTVGTCSQSCEGIVVIHGTDTLSITGECIVRKYPELAVPCVLTGAMRPWIMRNTDALQNLVESFSVVKLVEPGVYVAMHNRILQFPGVVKDTKHLRFVKKES